MIVSVRTPLRVSLFGGGSDYPAYFHRAPGSVLGFTIDKYIYISALSLTAAVDYRFRVSYSKVEAVDSIDEIEHPVVRAVLKHYKWDHPTDFSIQADLPAAAGLGSSSAFSVSMVNLVSHLTGTPRTRMELAREAIFTEQVLLAENVGIQDQLHASFGGINRFDFHGNTIRVVPISISGTEVKRLADWMVLVFTGIKRRATVVVRDQVQRIASKDIDVEIRELLALVDEGQTILEDETRRDEAPMRIGKLLHEAWKLKKRFSKSVSSPTIDDLYEQCIGLGALGGKLCGAGGGGFLLMIVPPEQRRVFEDTLGTRRCLRFQVDMTGTRLVTGSISQNGL